MKSTDAFKKTIQDYLNNRAANDELFAAAYAKEHKNIDDCITYIFNAVKTSGCNGFTDEEVFGMAVHYYDEDELNVGSQIRCNVVVNHTVELTEEEKAAAKKKAMEIIIATEKERLTKKTSKKLESIDVPTLF